MPIGPEPEAGPADVSDTAEVSRRPLQRFVVPFVLALAAVQVIQGLLARPELTWFQKSYWLVTYEFGFTRRGLGGELFRIVTGTSATDRQIDASAWVFAVLAIVLVLALALELVRRGSSRLELVAILLVTSPFVIDFLIYQRRPDQLGFVVVLAITLAWAWFPRRLMVGAAAGGVALAVAVLVQDAVLLECVPWVLLLSFLAAWRARASWCRTTVLALLACGPAVVAGVLSLVAGRVSPTVVEQLTDSAARSHPWVLRPDAGPGILGFLDDDLGTSLDFVTVRQPSSIKVGSVVVGLVLLVTVSVAAWLAVSGGVRRRSVGGASTGWRVALASALGLTMVGLGLLLALGTDWARWFAVYGFMATVTFCSWALSEPPSTSEDPVPSSRPAVVLTLAMFTLWLAPLWDSFFYRDAVRFLFMVPL